MHTIRTLSLGAALLAASGMARARATDGAPADRTLGPSQDRAASMAERAFARIDADGEAL